MSAPAPIVFHSAAGRVTPIHNVQCFSCQVMQTIRGYATSAAFEAFLLRGGWYKALRYSRRRPAGWHCPVHAKALGYRHGF